MVDMSLYIPDLDEHEIVKNSIDLADHYLIQGHWPSHQSVFKAVMEIFGVTFPPEVLRILSGFGSGGGFSGGICGALSGSLAALSFVYGTSKPLDVINYNRFLRAILEENLSPLDRAEELLESFPKHIIYNKMVERFKCKFGYTECRNLVAPFNVNPVSRRRFGTCRRIVRTTAGIAVQLILSVEKGKEQLAMGENIYSHLFK